MCGSSVGELNIHGPPGNTLVGLQNAIPANSIQCSTQLNRAPGECAFEIHGKEPLEALDVYGAMYRGEGISSFELCLDPVMFQEIPRIYYC